jgi:hypothetical protein
MDQMNKGFNLIECVYYSITNFIDKTKVEQLLNFIEYYSSEFAIRGFTLNRGANNPRYKPIDKEYIHKQLCDAKNISSISFGGNKPYHFDLWLDFGNGKIVRNRYNMTLISIRIDINYFLKDGKGNNERLNNYLNLCKDIYKWANPLCGYCHDVDDKLALSVSLSKRGVFRFFGFAFSTEYGLVEQPHLDCPITGIYWANYIGPKGVSFYGRERILQAPGVVQKEELEDGGILLLTATHPLTPDDPEHRANQLALWKFLNLKPYPNLKVIAKYKSSDRWEGAKPSFEPE